ncbi:Sensory box/GGDEF family protein [Salipiger mucosus DSM 16094]|uniref:Sensory box/GGDEF family protein n=2 Tax=Salipiger mucosus TaxID=263378 RepID=S9R4K1_9RHOB|nr:Sensory box/GGDEF family protein [Salipiger mucosus DSM 16094]
MLAFLPALSLAGFWMGGEAVLLMLSLSMPLLYMVAGDRGAALAPTGSVAALGADLVDAQGAQELADRMLHAAREAELSTACYVIEAAELDALARHFGQDTAETLRELMLRRIRTMLRREDLGVRIGDARYLVLLGPALRLDLETQLAVADRLQRAVEEPAETATGTHYLTACIGFCGLSRLPDGSDGAQLLEAAQTALADAQANGPSAVRAWSVGMRAERRARVSLLSDIDRALANGQIQPWYQPQLCTSTGRISGVEALARWLHPERGIVPPADFLGPLDEAGQMDRLSETILQHALTALRGWDAEGIDLPRVSVNFSATELRNPQLVARIRWELDRFGLDPRRLAIEVLETVIAESPEGIVARNILGLSELGCHIDLDDFGTGHASITALRRFPVHRLKIDRSFVSRIDRDEEQRRMLAAILGLADRLDLETLAEGVESAGEHALLAQLGCDHVQGFGIARPMPAAHLSEWARSHAREIAGARDLGRSSG